MIFYPNKYIKTIEEITIEFLQKNKIKALILDVDNTLVNYKKEMPERIEKWAKELQGQGTKLFIVSSNFFICSYLSNLINLKKRFSSISSSIFLFFKNSTCSSSFNNSKKVLLIRFLGI